MSSLDCQDNKETFNNNDINCDHIKSEEYNSMDVGVDDNTQIDEGCLDDNFSESENTTDSKTKSNSSRRRKRVKRLGVDRIYGLRPRTGLRRPSYDCDSDEKDSLSKRDCRMKTRSPVVTKCRRVTANARERHRMKEINDAFLTLRGILPTFQSRPSTRVSMTKIRTLRLAASYIQALSDLLSGSEPSIEGTTDNQLEDIHNTRISASIEEASNRSKADSYKDTSHFYSHPDNQRYLAQNQEQMSNEATDRQLSWINIPTTDEELFSLLEKEVLHIKSQPLHQPNSTDINSQLTEMSWQDDILSLGCK